MGGKGISLPTPIRHKGRRQDVGLHLQVPQVIGETMEMLWLIAVQTLTAVLWFWVGHMRARRNVDAECEIAYLSGHVDGYNRAVFDSGEVPW